MSDIGALESSLEGELSSRSPSEPSGPWPPPSPTMATSRFKDRTNPSLSIENPDSPSLSRTGHELDSLELNLAIPDSSNPAPAPNPSSSASQESRTSIFTQVSSKTRHAVTNNIGRLNNAPNEDSQEELKYPSLRFLEAENLMPGALPITPVPTLMKKLPDTGSLFVSPGRTSTTHRTPEPQPISSQEGTLPPSKRSPMSRPASSSISTIRLDHFDGHQSCPTTSCQNSPMPTSEGEYTRISHGDITSPRHRYPPLLHRTGDGMSSLRELPVQRPKKETVEEVGIEGDEGARTRTASSIDEEYWKFYDDPFTEDLNPINGRQEFPLSLFHQDPIIIAHAPKHQALLDKLPVGTLWSLAMVAKENSIDVEDLPVHRLNALVDQKNLARGEVEKALGRDVSDNEESKDQRTVAEKLDWEAEEIVKGSGAMLGCSEERNTKYGGQVQFAVTLRWENPRKNSSQSIDIDLQQKGILALEPLSLRCSCIFTRTFGSHRFLRLRICQSVLKETFVYTSRSEMRKKNQERLQEWVSRPIIIFGRVYAPLVEKDGVMHYFMEGEDLVGHVFEGGRRNYGIQECRTVSDLIDWWIPLQFNENQTMSKLVARLELGISDTLPGILIEPQNIEIVDDITNDAKTELFTDGAGLMTPSVAKALARKYFPLGSNEIPVAYQVRIQTAKGVLLVDPMMLREGDFSLPHSLRLYRSMVKAMRVYQPRRNGPVHGLHILDAAACMLCIVKPAPISSANGARLSGQFITILSDCGVPDQVFLQLQSEALKKELTLWTDVTLEDAPHGGKRLDEPSRLRLARLVGKNQGLALMMKKHDLAGEAKGRGYGRDLRKKEIEESTDDEKHRFVPDMSLDSIAPDATTSGSVELRGAARMHTKTSGLPALKPQQLQGALYAGIEVHKSAYFTKIWRDLVHDSMVSAVSRFHPTVERSGSGFFQPDPTGLLKEGEIFFSPKEDMYDPDTGQRINVITGCVLIGRHPALLPTDIRKVKAVNVALLEHFRGIVFVSVRGACSLASICAGGDHDGDEALIIWEPTIVTPFRNAPLYLRDPPPNFEKERFRLETVPVAEVRRKLDACQNKSEYSMELTRHLVASIGEGETFKIYNEFHRQATYRFGLRKEDEADTIAHSARMMAYTFNVLLDNKKSGWRIKPEILAQDRQWWSKFEQPYWWLRGKKKENQGNKLRLRLQGSPQFVLDLLFSEGDREVGLAMKEIDRMLDSDSQESGLYFEGNGNDEDLLKPWKDAREYAFQASATKPEIQKELDGITRAVEECRERWLGCMKNWRKAPRRTMVDQLRDISHEYAATPFHEEVPSFLSVVGDESLRWVKASYAYALDMGIPQGEGLRKGYPRGFCWNVAMRDLFSIKANAISDRDTFTMPHSVRDRLEPPKLFA